MTDLRSDKKCLRYAFTLLGIEQKNENMFSANIYIISYRFVPRIVQIRNNNNNNNICALCVKGSQNNMRGKGTIGGSRNITAFTLKFYGQLDPFSFPDGAHRNKTLDEYRRLQVRVFRQFRVKHTQFR
jgi:hypothetical protein